MSEQVLKTLKVGLEDRAYPIFIGHGLGSQINKSFTEHLGEGKKVVVLIDDGFSKKAPLFAKELLSRVSTLKLPSGESTKSVQFLSKIWDFLASEEVDRTGVVFALGGGVTGDLSGFAAASYLRGLDFYQVPTTLLAMVDSSVGGKTGINLSAGKNLVGAFHQPKAVFIDLDCLSTLPKREFSAGMAEVIKYGLLGNKSLYHKLLSFSKPLNSESKELPEIIETCCLDKAKIVESDERESIESSGGRALLNLGHTFAHAIESVAGYGEYLHGEAVSIGLICALRLSRMSGYCSDADEKILESLLQSYALPVKLRFDLCTQALMNAMQSDKKVKAGKIRFVVLKEIGDAFLSSSFDTDQVLKIWNSVGAK
jgi:3-dehydroquinate synthase